MNANTKEFVIYLDISTLLVQADLMMALVAVIRDLLCEFFVKITR